MSDELILGRYRPITQIGSGGFATVQLAWDMRIQRRVAIKCLQLDPSAAALTAGADTVSAYEIEHIPGLAEARTAAMLQDPNIVGILDFEVQGTVAYLIMEYVDGLTLSKLIDDYPDYITLDVVAAVFAGVAHALDVAHSNQVLHLDIKPDNVMINRQGQVKVTDFGLAELSTAQGFSKASGGTIGYMPLEQMRLEPLDARCDEWALASITYEMLTGHNPFGAENLEKAQVAIEEAEILLPSICQPELDEEADEVLFYALDPDKTERYDSVHDFAEELQPFLGNVRRGTKQLAHLVGQAGEDTGETDEEETAVMSAITERMGGFGGFGKLLSSGTVMRIWSLISCLLLGYVACVGNAWLDPLPEYVRPIVLVVLCLITLGVPHVGAALSMIALAAAFASHASYFCAALAGVCGIAWWVVLGRRGLDEPATMLCPASLGAVGCAAASPLVSGVNLNVKDGIVNLLCSAGLAVSLATLGSQAISGWRAFDILPTAASRFTGSDQVLLNMVTQPSFWIALASWILAVVLVAAISGEGKTVRRITGIVVGALVLAGALVGQTYLASKGSAFVPAVNEMLVLVAVTALSLAFSIARAR